MRNLAGLRVAVIASDGFEESELMEPVRALRSAKADVVVVGPRRGKIQGFKGFEKTHGVEVEQVLADLDADDFDAVVLPGGTLNADTLRMDEDLRALLRAFQADGRPIAAICHAPWELVSADLVRGRTLTSYHTLQDDIRNAGGNWVDQEVVVDGNLVTSRKPADLPAFNRAVNELLAAQLRDEPATRRSRRKDTGADATL